MAVSHQDLLLVGDGALRYRERFSDILVEQAVELGAEVLATACPYCILNFKDSVLTMGREDVLEVRDVSEIVAEVM